MEDTPSPARVFFENQPQYTMQGVISFLKSEATRHEQDNSEWARERKKLTDRIDSLEQQCSAHKKMEVDLVERVKLLEFALAEERQHRFEMASSQPTQMHTPTEADSSPFNSGATPLDTRELPSFMRDSAAAHRGADESPLASSSSSSATVRHDDVSPKTLFAAGPGPGGAGAAAGLSASSGGGTAAAAAAGVRSSIQDFFSSGGGAKGRGERGGGQEWVRYGGLRSHLDGVRAVAFGGSGATLVSAGDDGSVKLWSLKAVKALTKDGTLPTDVEPVITFRGHSGQVLSAAMEGGSSSRLDVCCSGGADGTVRVWTLPPMAQDLYDSTGVSVRQQRACLSGHTDAVWSVQLHPFHPLLASASADGSLRLWDLQSFASLASLSLPSSSSPSTSSPPSSPPADAALGPAPTCCQFLTTESSRLLVAFKTGRLALYDVPTAAPSLLFPAPSSSSQPNALAVHPSLSLALTAHEDASLRLHDIASGQAAADGALFVWDLRQRAVVAEIWAHNRVFGQGATSVAYHPTRPMVASGGCDALVALHVQSS